MGDAFTMSVPDAARASKRRRGIGASALGSPETEMSQAGPSSINPSSRRTSASSSASPALSPGLTRGSLYGTRSRKGVPAPNREQSAVVNLNGRDTTGAAEHLAVRSHTSSPLKSRASSPAGTQTSSTTNTREKSARVKERQRAASAGGAPLADNLNGGRVQTDESAEPTMSPEEEARLAQEQKDAEEMWQRWSEEYFEGKCPATKSPPTNAVGSRRSRHRSC